VIEIPVIGDLTEQEAEICEKLLAIPPGGECTLYFNSPGGSSYSAVSVLSLMVLRKVRATGIVAGECSSAALWPLAACHRRYVTPYSVLLFHPMRWQSEEGVQLLEAAEWARHFAHLEQEMDDLLAAFLGLSKEQLQEWMKPGRYVSGREFAEAGLAELLDLSPPARGRP
jgi:ATP-dependent protease ClpP protease subunit